MVALIETKNHGCRYMYLKRILGMEEMHAVEPRGSAGSLCLMWKDEKNIFLVKYSEFFFNFFY